jgi:hypothetical protein
VPPIPAGELRSIRRRGDVYAKKGAKVFDLDEATVEKWRAIARDTAWKDYAQKSRCLRSSSSSPKVPRCPDVRRDIAE